MRPMIARLLAAALCGFPLALDAQPRAYPNKAVRIVAPFPAGGSADVIPRIIGEKLSLKWGQPRSEEHTSELQSQSNLVCRLLLEKKKHEEQALSYNDRAQMSGVEL